VPSCYELTCTPAALDDFLENSIWAGSPEKIRRTAKAADRSQATGIVYSSERKMGPLARSGFLPRHSRQLSQSSRRTSQNCCAVLCVACRAVLWCTALVCLLQLASAQFGGGMPGMGMPEQPKAHAVKSDVQYIKCQACEALVKQAYRHTKTKREGLKPHQKVCLGVSCCSSRFPPAWASPQAAHPLAAASTF
jgi:hypothetical protein